MWCETPWWRSRASACETRCASIARPPSAWATCATSASAAAPWPKRVPVPAIPGPTEQTATSATTAAQRSADADRHAAHVAAEARGDGYGRLEQAALSQGAHRVRQRERQRAALHLHVRDADACESSTRWGDLGVDRAEHHRQPAERLGEHAVLLRVADRPLPRRVGQRHHVRALVRREVEPARQVRVENVEASGAERELARLHVHEHLVAVLDRPVNRG